MGLYLLCVRTHSWQSGPVLRNRILILWRLKPFFLSPTWTVEAKTNKLCVCGSDVCHTYYTTYPPPVWNSLCSNDQKRNVLVSTIQSYFSLSAPPHIQFDFLWWNPSNGGAMFSGLEKTSTNDRAYWYDVGLGFVTFVSVPRQALYTGGTHHSHTRSALSCFIFHSTDHISPGAWLCARFVCIFVSNRHC